LRARSTQVALEAGLPVAILLVWWLSSRDSTSFYFPPLQKILHRFALDWTGPRLGADLWPSLCRLVVGYLIAAVVGVGAGVLLGSSRIASRLASPSVTFLRYLPPVALLPVWIVLLGIGDGMKYAVIAFGAVWPILLNTTDAILDLDPQLLRSADSYQIHGVRRLLWVLLPAAAPRSFAGLRIGLSIAIILMIVSEMVGSNNGLGYITLHSERTFDIPGMWSGILLLGLIGYFSSLLFTVAEMRLLRWHFAERATR
jgi:ABC-type nitrate/sulfonate/bicarbonate transport system permease component